MIDLPSSGPASSAPPDDLAPGRGAAADRFERGKAEPWDGEARSADLVRRCLAGDLSAFESLVERYKRAIYNLAYYKSRNAFDAEDLTQDIFLAAYNALSSLKDPELFSGWLMGIAHNRCHKWFRRERTRILKFKEIHFEQERNARLVARTDEEVGEEGGVDLGREIHNLPHEIRRVLVLKYLEGLSYEDIEAQMGIKAYRIDYLIRKGKSLLRRRLRHLESSGGE